MTKLCLGVLENARNTKTSAGEREPLEAVKKKQTNKNSNKKPRGFTWTHFLPCLPLAATSILLCIHMVIGVRR